MDEECYTGRGEMYRGDVAITTSGLTCQNWESQFPNEHDFTDANYPDTGLGNHNYCRNPQASPLGPWCYNAEGTVEYCEVPRCDCQDDEDFRDGAGNTCSWWEEFDCNFETMDEEWGGVAENCHKSCGLCTGANSLSHLISS